MGNSCGKKSSPQPKVSNDGAPQVDDTASKSSITDKYTVGDEIGRGAFSIVKSAIKKDTGDKVAIKFIEKKFVDRTDLVLLAREIDIMKKVDHPNILKLYEVYETDDIIALVMEFVNGGELFYKIVDIGNYSEGDAANIVKQMMEGVCYLHGKGIAHRDLKPENLLCSQDPKYSPFRVVIADFGLSKIFDQENPLETSCGTPDYVAPEVITAEGHYDISVDMWSTGVITYVLLCGFSPFLSATQTGLFEKIINVSYTFPSPEWDDISSTAKDFIKKLLVKKSSDRMTAAQALQHRWLTDTAGTTTIKAQTLNDYNIQRQKDIKKT